MNESPNTGDEPKDKKNGSAHGPLLSNSNLKEKESNLTERNANDSDSKHNPSGVAMGWLSRHSNSLQAVFNGLLVIITALYTVFAYLQWCSNKKAAAASLQLQQQIQIET